MKIGILHQYSLYGSGSSVYVRDIARLLANLGHEIHLMSLEPQPQRYDFFDAAYIYHDGNTEIIFRRAESPSCTSHTFSWRVVPVAYERVDLTDTKLFVALSNTEIEDYVAFFCKMVKMVARRYALDVIHAHHAVLSPYIAYRVKEETGIPYVVTIHGSAIEYVVRRDARYRHHATKGLEGASNVIVLNQDVRERVLQICPGIESKLVEIPVGVDTDAFRPLAREQRSVGAHSFIQNVATRKSLGKTAELQRETLLASEMVDEAKIAAVTRDIRHRYDARCHDENLVHKLAQIDWEKDNVLVYFGKLLFDKGVHCIIMALPNILAALPDTKLIIIGSGADREFFEMGVAALDWGCLGSFQRVMRAGVCGQKNPSMFYEYIVRFLEQTDQKTYADRARGRMIKSVIFTGYLTRTELARLLPCARATLIPSIVKEAFPLVSVESLASGVMPIGSYFSGLKPLLDEVSILVGKYGELIKIGHSQETMVRDLSQNVPALLSLMSNYSVSGEISSVCRELVEQKYGWKSLISEIESLYVALKA